MSNDGTSRYHPNLTCEHTYVCEGCGHVFGNYDAAKVHVERCAPAAPERDRDD